MVVYSCNDLELDNSNDNVDIQSDIGSLSQEAMDRYMSKYTKVESVGLRDSTFSCFYKDFCQPKVHYTDTIEIPGYSGCEAIVEWDQQYCPTFVGGSWVATITIDNFTASPYSVECDSMMTEWFNLFTSGDYDDLDEAITDFEYAAYHALETDILTGWVEDHAPAVTCDGNNWAISAEYGRTTCYRRCVKFVIKKGVPIISWANTYCGYACCITTTPYCWDVVNQEVRIGDSTTRRDGFCEEELPSGTGAKCPAGYFSLSRDCLDHCED